ncbi:succinylglutamate desuccinylase/aspartoacylase family protein [Taklimakanibacter deserti]|uniref:succinylglutamate desuccinylase/aspartoacylase family protein n=1 Tax=Taklimakanibacter deserti TaxID=2267839 RepID=UPI0013C533F7
MEAGLHKAELTFDYPALAGWRWPAVEIVGQSPGPRLAVISGVHVNETSSIEAVIRLQRMIDPQKLKGRISIIPIVNLPAVPLRSQYVCPIDDKNINFSFPGRPDGSFSEALAYALLNDWAHDADCFADLHGGDLCEEVSHFMVVQRTGDDPFDQRNLAIAQCFDAAIIAAIDPSHMDQPARSVTGRAKRRQFAAFAEAGRIGLIEEPNVAYHLNGLLRLLHHFGMTDSAPAKTREARIITRYHWIPAPVDGFFRYHVEPGQKVAKGQLLATAENTYGEEIARVSAPEEGHILWRITHALSPRDSFIVGLGTKA